MIILGVHLETHDSGVAIIRDGAIAYASNEERFTRKKMDKATPVRSLADGLRHTGLAYGDIDTVAISGLQPGMRKLFAMARNQRVFAVRLGDAAASGRPSFRAVFHRALLHTGIVGLRNSWKMMRRANAFVAHLRAQGFRGNVAYVDHDLCHAASAYFTSGFDDAFVAVIEGSSFTNTCSLWKGDGGTLTKVDETPLPHSVGKFYECVTRILGFKPNRHAGKITGLAALGDPRACYAKVEPLLSVRGTRFVVDELLFRLDREYEATGKLPAYFDGCSREDIAAAFQKRLEDTVLELFRAVAKRHSIARLALCGGVVANVKLNMEIARLPDVEKLWVCPGMSDVGQALGAALVQHARVTPSFRPFQLADVYLGPSFSDDDIERALRASGLRYRKSTSTAEDVAAYLVQNKVIALYQGRMEFGPRALGNRSIMYPAVDRDVNGWLNKRLNRTEFMPFAPVTLAERAKDCYLETEKTSVAAEFMTVAMPTTRFMQERMPAAVHVDGTARPQLIRQATNPLYYGILKEYEKLTGLPSLVNTSFNMHEEPIICTPAEAITSFVQSKLDYLVLENYIVEPVPADAAR